MVTATTPRALHAVATPLSSDDINTVQKAHLDDLQGNILKSHGRRHTANVFLRFKAGKVDQARAWLRGPLKQRITSAFSQLKATEKFNADGQDGGVHHSFVVSASGYVYLGKEIGNFSDPSFKAGIKASVAKLNDPAVDVWEPGFQHDIHAMVLIADSRPANLRFLAKELRMEVMPFADVVAVEFGDQQFNARDDGIEHFGYVDGRSQPLMLLSDLDGQSDGSSVWDPTAGPAQVLVADPFGQVDSSGSYFVFRKLEEKVKAFKAHEQVLATALGLTGDARELAGALVVGRFEDGTPVTLSDEPMIESSAMPNGSSVPNNFDYRDDLDGRKCPFHAHIRKSNPRGAGPGGLNDEMTRHMARRGITYGDRAADTFDDISTMPDGNVGLLFMAYQRSIVDQFEFIQQAWVNDPAFPQNTGGTGTDPVIGQSPSTPQPKQKWPKAWDDRAQGKVDFSFRDFVVMKGGEYFFAPSLSGIGTL